MSRRRGQDAVTGLTALAVLLAILGGLPVLLYRLGGSPLPAQLPGWHQLAGGLLHRDSGTAFLAAVRDISWLAWAAFCLAVLAETQALLRRRSAPQLRLGPMQDAAGRLVALVALTFTAAPVSALLALPQPASAAVTVAAAPQAAATAAPSAARPDSLTDSLAAALADSGPDARPDSAAIAAPGSALAGPSAASWPDSPAPPQPDVTAMPPAEHPVLSLTDSPAPQPDHLSAAPASQVVSMGFYQLVTVRPGECLWDIAQTYLGDGDRYPEIVALNLGHQMGDGEVFTDPSVVWPGWVLQVPAGPATTSQAADLRPGHAAGGHEGRPSAPAPANLPRSGQSPPPAVAAPPPAAARAGGSAAPGSTSAPGGTSVSAGTSASDGAGAAPAVQAAGALPANNPIPLAAAFGAGVLAGGAAVSLARLRHRQRQGRRPGRRIPLPVSAPVIEAEQRLRAAAPQRSVTALRGTLSSLGAALVLGGQQIPDVAGVRLLPDSMELLLGSLPADPPPPPFSGPGGGPGQAWRLSLAGEPPRPAAEAGDLLPGLLTIGAVDGGYLLVDLEHLQVTTVDGPPELAEAVLGSAAAELATGELSGWYDLILVGFPELAVLGGRGTCCQSLDAGLDLLAAKAVALRRRLGRAARADVRYHRLAEPGDEDWALTLLVSRIAPAPSQLAMLVDLAGEPGGIAALVAGGTVAGGRAPASIELAPEPAAAGGMIARIRPLQLEAWPEPLQDTDYRALANLFAVATDGHDVDPGDPPYDSWSWPPDLAVGADQDGEAGQSGARADYEQGAAGDGTADGWPGELPGAGPAGWPAEGWAGDSGPGEPWRQYPMSDPADALPELAGAADAEDDLADLWTGQVSPEVAESGPGEADDGAAAGPWTPQAGSEAADAAPAGANGRPAPAGQAWATKAGAAHPDPPAALRIGVLGTFTINGQPGALLPAQSQLVLALALNAAGGLSNQQLCYLLGADPDHPKPSDSLRQLLVRTRRQLSRAADGREWIEHLGAGQYALHPEARVDWHEFDSLARQGIQAADADCLRTALGLIRGQPFTGCYYWWLDLALTETVRAQIVDTADTLAGLELAAGDPAAAARAARTGLTGDAGAEQLWRSLMMAEHAAGNLTGVREAWNRCLEVISELAPDGEPHPRTAALYRDLMGGGPHTAWTGG